jgi:hypothetical protein
MKLSALALSYGLPRAPSSLSARALPASPYGRGVQADSSVVAHSTEGFAVGTRRRRSDRSGRGVSRSPGRPGVARREDRRRFWTAIAAGRSSEDAALCAGVSPAVGARWFREAGGMPPATLAPAARPPSGRYLSFADREEIALWRVQGHGVREIARRLGRSAVDDLAGAAAQCCDARRRSGLSGHHRAVARRAGRAASEAGEAGGQRGAAALRAGPAGRRGRRPGRSRGPRAGRALEGPAARAAAASAMGQGVEPGADRSSPAARLSRR